MAFYFGIIEAVLERRYFKIETSKWDYKDDKQSLFKYV